MHCLFHLKLEYAMLQIGSCVILPIKDDFASVILLANTSSGASVLKHLSTILQKREVA